MQQLDMVPQHPLDLSPVSLRTSNARRSSLRRTPVGSGTFGLDKNLSPALVCEDDTTDTMATGTPIASMYMEDSQQRHRSEDDQATCWPSTSESTSDEARARARFTFGYDDTYLKEEDVLKILPSITSPPDTNSNKYAILPPLPLSSPVHSPRIHSTTRTPQSSKPAAAGQPSSSPSSAVIVAPTTADAARYSFHGPITGIKRHSWRNSSFGDHSTLTPQRQGQLQDTSGQNLRLRPKQRLSFLANMISTVSPSPPSSSSPLPTTSSSFATRQFDPSIATGVDHNVFYREKPLPPVPAVDARSNLRNKPTIIIPLSELPKRLTATATSATIMAHTDMHESGALSSHDRVAADTSSNATPHQPATMTSGALSGSNSGFLVSAPTKSKRVMFGASASSTSLTTPSPPLSPAHVRPPLLQTLQAQGTRQDPTELRRYQSQTEPNHSRRISITVLDTLVTSPVLFGFNGGSISSSSTGPGGVPCFETSQESLVVATFPSPSPPSLPLSPLILTNGSENTLSNSDPDDPNQRRTTGPRHHSQRHGQQHGHSYQSKPLPQSPHRIQARKDDLSAIASATPTAVVAIQHAGKDVPLQNHVASHSVFPLSTPPSSSSLHAKSFIMNGDSEDKAAKTKRKRGISLSLFCMCFKK